MKLIKTLGVISIPNRYSIKDTNAVKFFELIGVLLAIVASITLSVSQGLTDMRLLFGLFFCSSLILTITTYLGKNYNFLLMSCVYLLVNLNGLVRSI